MATGTLFDVQDNILLTDCTIDEALHWLRAFDGRGWEGGNTLWLPEQAAVVFADATSNFAQIPHYQAIGDL